jgi:hypothetical protein
MRMFNIAGGKIQGTALSKLVPNHVRGGFEIQK